MVRTMDDRPVVPLPDRFVALRKEHARDAHRSWIGALVIEFSAADLHDVARLLDVCDRELLDRLGVLGGRTGGA